MGLTDTVHSREPLNISAKLVISGLKELTLQDYNSRQATAT